MTSNISPATVRGLLRAQFPAWAELELTPVESDGTDNAMFRLGPRLAVRIPHRAEHGERLVKEQRWLPTFAEQLPVAIPRPLALGAPTAALDRPWAVVEWIAGENPTAERSGESARLAGELGTFLRDLRSLDPSGGPAPGDHNFWRGCGLVERDAAFRAALERCPLAVDAARALAVWNDAMDVSGHTGPRAWVHGD
ncbi:MAG: phosphotransferase, partial [Planctomycetota bacterium]